MENLYLTTPENIKTHPLLGGEQFYGYVIRESVNRLLTYQDTRFFISDQMAYGSPRVYSSYTIDGIRSLMELSTHSCIHSGPMEGWILLDIKDTMGEECFTLIQTRRAFPKTREGRQAARRFIEQSPKFHIR